MTPTKTILVSLCLFTLVTFVACSGNSQTNTNTLKPGSADYESAWETAQEWARFSDLPTTADSIQIQTEGGAFSREFVIYFSAPPADIQRWLDESPGSKNVTPEINGGVRRYRIAPGGGAQSVVITVDENEQSVEIRTYWS